MSMLDREADNPEAIKSSALNITLGSAAAATIATLVTVFNESFDKIFGTTAGPGIKAAVLIAIIAAWAFVAVADITGRAIAKAATARAEGLERAAKASAVTPAPSIVPLPQTLKATRLKGADEAGFLAVGQLGSTNGDARILIVKAGRAPEWVDRDDVDLSA